LKNVWNYIKETKLINYSQAGFINICELIGVFDSSISNELQRIQSIKDVEEQDIQLNKLLNNHPGSFILWYFRCTLYQELGRYKKAIYYFHEYLQKFTEHQDQLLGYYGLGVTYNKMGEFDNATLTECDIRQFKIKAEILNAETDKVAGAIQIIVDDFEKQEDEIAKWLSEKVVPAPFVAKIIDYWEHKSQQPKTVELISMQEAGMIYNADVERENNYKKWSILHPEIRPHKFKSLVPKYPLE
jgi:tetratricopeptide (TPR) repeat protein